MIARLRSLMSTPFARPPGRRSVWVRFAPEWCALAVWLVFLGTFVILQLAAGRSRRNDAVMENMFVAAPVAYGLAGLVLFVLPLAQGSWAWATEKTRETVPALVMTPLDHRAVAWGRFWHATLPWLRFFGCLLPVYVLGASHRELVRAVSDEWQVGMLCSFAPKPLAVVFGVAAAREGARSLDFSLEAQGFLALRVLNDFSWFFFTIGTAYFFSMFCRTAIRALLAALVTVILFRVTFGALDIWWLVLAEGAHFGDTMSSVGGSMIACLLVLVRLALPLFLVAWAARRFDAWAVDEKP